MELREFAHSRTGDKGNLITISVIAYRPEDFSFLLEMLSVVRVTEHFREFVDRPVERYVLHNLCALTFVLHRPLNQSVTRSLALDAHGKSLGSAILSLSLTRAATADESSLTALTSSEMSLSASRPH